MTPFRPTVLLVVSLVAGFALLALATCSNDASGDRRRCDLCGMYVDRNPRWIAGGTKNGRPVFFDSPRCMLQTLRDRRSGLREPWVTEYYAQRRRPAASVRYVQGSDTIGPMGPDLVPVDPVRAETFRRDHRGTRVLTLDQITPAVLRSLDARR
ncbi:MAG: nitrous oxide reductase accessory protein NosL [Deltaproteobacteria bacterium]|nr:nitrous oxide reductase accessory protein NosL [Deltaproteobacteria bacterium]